jgi:hypothetical protein
VLALGLSPGASSLWGQQVVLRKGSQGDAAAEAVVERVLARGEYRVVVQDTTVGAGEVVRGDVIVIGATLRIEGHVEGDVVGIQSDIFARPGGRIDGTVVVLGGGFYGSSLAELGERPINASRLAYTVEERADGSYQVTAPGGRASVRLAGLYGLLAPQYDRVNALTVPVGLDFEAGGSSWMPDAEARVRYRSVREQFDGDLQLRWRLGRQSVTVRGGRTVRSNDRWINGDLENSVYAFVGAVDTRNYYDAYFADAGLKLAFGQTTVWSSGLTLGWEQARPLENRSPFSLFEVRAGGFQPNLPVADTEIASLALGGAVQVWGGGASSLAAELRLEVADQDVAGDLSFALLAGALRAVVRTAGDQELLLEGSGQLPFSDDAPSQRWRALGAWGTLPTLVPTGRVGDHMWWLGATYLVPVGDAIGRIGRLTPWVQYAAGNAWSENGTRPSTVHDIGLGLRFGPLSAAVYTSPSDDFKTVFSLGFEARRWPPPGP